MKMIRWKGLIAFVAVSAGIAAFFMLIADGLVEKTVESTGTRIVGAKVDLADADLSFFPLGINLTGMAITNPDAPMKNTAEIEQIRFSLNPWDLIEKKVIINEMAVSGVRFNTDRSVSGAVEKASKTDKEKKDATPTDSSRAFKLPSLAPADVQTILSREELRCIKEIERLEADITQKEQELREMVQDLPDEETFDNYRDRLNRLDDEKGVMGILSGISQAGQLKEDIQADLNRIRQAKQEVETAVDTLEKRLKEVAKTPQQDIARLKEKYSISPKGLGNLTRLVFGPQYGQWMDRALSWYEKLKPWIAKAGSIKSEKSPEEVKPARGKGVNVRFAEHTPKPDFLIHLTTVSVNTGRGDMTGRIKDIASDQTITGRPTTWAFDSTTLKNIETLAVNGALDHTNPAKTKDTLQIDAKNVQLKDVAISDSHDFPLRLDSGRLALKMDTAITNGRLRSDGNFTLTGAAFSGKPDQSMSRVQSAIIRSISGIPAINISTTVKGTPQDPSMKIASNADTVVRNAVENIVREETAALEKQLRQVITAKTDSRISDLTGSINGLDQISKKLNRQLNQGNAMLMQ
ncbi:MAG: TIGR03545 family protein [Thermodesulfobacteriota bacterium]|nr:TIGR03545 family protein [Thermodesulfobacteriota bacterium]